MSQVLSLTECRRRRRLRNAWARAQQCLACVALFAFLFGSAIGWLSLVFG